MFWQTKRDYQQGYGIGNVFRAFGRLVRPAFGTLGRSVKNSGVGRFIKPVLKEAVAVAGPVAVDLVKGLLKDAFTGKRSKETALARGKQAGVKATDMATRRAMDLLLKYQKEQQGGSWAGWPGRQFDRYTIGPTASDTARFLRPKGWKPKGGWGGGEQEGGMWPGRGGPLSSDPTTTHIQKMFRKRKRSASSKGNRKRKRSQSGGRPAKRKRTNTKKRRAPSAKKRRAQSTKKRRAPKRTQSGRKKRKPAKKRKSTKKRKPKKRKSVGSISARGMSVKQRRALPKDIFG